MIINFNGRRVPKEGAGVKTGGGAWMRVPMNVSSMLLLVALSAAPRHPAHQAYDQDQAQHLVPYLLELIRFPTLQGEAKAHADQKAWLLRVAKESGLVARDAGKVVEI